MSTIFALATPAGRGAVAIIRVSGKAADASLAQFIRNEQLPEARKTSLRTLYDPQTGQKIDKAMVIRFKAPASFTGEDVVEYHLHNGISVVQSMLAALGRMASHRLAEPGEFTRRGFENNRMDLTEAEAVADLIAAETEAQRLQALSQMEGTLGALYSGWAAELSHILAYVEADLDFSDQDLPEDLLLTTAPRLEPLIAAIGEHLNDNRRGERLREGIRLAIVGAPNAGKSTLLNALSQREVAIVSDFAGTTRDVLDVHLDIAGYPVLLSDTAGLRQLEGRDAHEQIEAEGIRRARERASAADIRLCLFDGQAADIDKDTLEMLDDNAVLVITKADLFDAEQSELAIKLAKYRPIIISAASQQGLGPLLAELKARLDVLAGSTSSVPTLTRARHRTALEEALLSLENAKYAQLPELLAEDLRLALRAIGRITGRVDVEDLLDMIFRDFCIGK